MSSLGTLGLVLIGRNEGARLIHALAAVSDARAKGGQVIYVDSGSTDGSQAAARAAGASVITLDMDRPFTAARARNAGAAALRPEIDRIQFIDGDCVLQTGWLTAAMAFLDTHPDVAAVCGRRREKHPEASVYNRLIDLEWDTPIGEARSCGGDVLMRRVAFEAVGQYNPDLIAGEEPELCVRLRAAGWRIWRLEAEMTLHDAALTRFGQVWQRSRRAGHAYAEGVALHGRAPERHNVGRLVRTLFWGAAVPVVTLILSLWLGPRALLVGLGLYGVQMARLALRDRDLPRAVLLVVGKFAETLGVLDYARRRFLRQESRLIEYK